MENDEDLIPYILEKAAELRNRSERKAANPPMREIVDPEQQLRVITLYMEVKHMFRGENNTVKCEFEKTDVCTGFITVIGKTVEFVDVRRFLYIASIADGIEVDERSDGNVMVRFYVENVTIVGM